MSYPGEKTYHIEIGFGSNFERYDSKDICVVIPGWECAFEDPAGQLMSSLLRAISVVALYSSLP